MKSSLKNAHLWLQADRRSSAGQHEQQLGSGKLLNGELEGQLAESRRKEKEALQRVKALEDVSFTVRACFAMLLVL